MDTLTFKYCGSTYDVFCAQIFLHELDNLHIPFEFGQKLARSVDYLQAEPQKLHDNHRESALQIRIL